jgi:hypothetical protein
VSTFGVLSHRSIGTFLVAGMAIGIVVVLLSGNVAATSSAGGAGLPLAASGSLSVYSHTGVVNRGVHGTYGSASVHSNAWAISTGPTTTTSSMSVLAGSVVFLFVGYVNGEIGGGYVAFVNDTLGDGYSLVLSTGYAQNHTQDLYVSAPVPRNASVRVSVTFAGGDTTMGGSVAAVDVVARVGVPTVDAVYSQSGFWGSPASVNVATTRSDDLLLLGVSGLGRDAPLSPAAGETLLNTAGNTSGPWSDGTGFGTFSAREHGTTATLSATLATPAEWTAIGVGIYGFVEKGIQGTTTTPTVRVVAGSVALIFVGFVNTEIGGGRVSSVSDNLHDKFSLVATTDFLQNHTQDLFATQPIAANGSLRVTVSFAGGDTLMGGSIALVDVVASSGTPAIDTVAMASGTWSGTALVNLTTTHSRDLLLLGVSGLGRDAPFAPGGGETLLNTGTNTSGPWEDGTGYGTFSASEHAKSATLSAALATPAEWTAIAVGIHIAPHAALAGAGAVVTPTLESGTSWVVATVVRAL